MECKWFLVQLMMPQELQKVIFTYLKDISAYS